MQIFKTTGAYVFSFCGYAFVAISTTHNVLKPHSNFHAQSPLLFRVPAIIGMLCIAIVMPGLIKKTSNILEKIVILLTEGASLLWLVNVLPDFGFTWAIIPNIRYFSAVVIFFAAVVVFIRLLVVISTGLPNSD